MTTINYAVSGNRRRELVNALAEILECGSEYLKAPSYAYRVGKFTVNRDGDIECPDEASEEEIENLPLNRLLGLERLVYTCLYGLPDARYRTEKLRINTLDIRKHYLPDWL